MRQETTNARQEANKEPAQHPSQIAILTRRGWHPIRNSLCSPSARCTRAHTARLTANYRLSSTCIRLDYLQASNGESARVRKVPPGPHSSTHSRTGSQAAFPCDKHASNTEMRLHRCACGSRRAGILPSYRYAMRTLSSRFYTYASACRILGSMYCEASTWASVYMEASLGG